MYLTQVVFRYGLWLPIRLKILLLNAVGARGAPVFRKYDVIHYCVPNIASRVARTATYALTNIFAPLLLDIGELGSLKNVIWQKQGIRDAVYIFQGQLTNKYMGERFSIQTKDLNLLIVSNR